MKRLKLARSNALQCSSWLAIGCMLPPFHDLSYQTIVLRTGLKLGFIRPFGGA